MSIQIDEGDLGEISFREFLKYAVGLFLYELLTVRHACVGALSAAVP